MAIPELFRLIIYIIVLGVLIWLVNYVVDTMGIPDPLNRVIKVVVIVICCLIAISLLLSLLGMGFPVVHP